MRRRRPSEESAEEVEANLTSMLDLIFNILAYFVATYVPPQLERNFDISLPPPQANQSESVEEMELPTEEESPFDQFSIRLEASADGRLARIDVTPLPTDVSPPRTPGGLARVLRRSAGVFAAGPEDEGLDAANVVAPPELKYRYVMEVVDACYQAGITKIGFLEGGGGGGGPAPPPVP